MVECDLAKGDVSGSSSVSRSRLPDWSTGSRQPRLRESPVPLLESSGAEIGFPNIDFELTCHHASECMGVAVTCTPIHRRTNPVAIPRIR